jgi:Domain of unknown function (DUF4260)
MTTTAAMVTDFSRDASPAAAPGMTQGAVRTWLRLEGLAAFGAGLALFGASGGNWLLVVPLLLLPDNLIHNWVPGIAVLGIGVWLGSPVIILAASILIAHVGMDRAVGYGLKLPSSFHDTHLGRMGRDKA